MSVGSLRAAVLRIVGGRQWHVVGLALVVVALPLLTALIALSRQNWHPVLDLAMTELRVRDAFGAHTPLIGLPGRIGDYPNQGSHPGPLYFYLIAPVYRMAGSSPWGLLAGAVLIHLAAATTALWIGFRRGGWQGTVAVAALLTVVIRGYGQVVLTQPWNPYQPLIAWVVVLLAAWSVACRDTLMLIPLVVAATLCAQTHVPYLVSCAALCVGALGYGWFVNRRHALVATAVGVGLWVPPILDQLVHKPGNIRTLIGHFGSPSEAPIGVAAGVKLALRHLDVWAGLVGQVTRTGQFVAPSTAWRGALTLLAWVGAAAVAWRWGSRALKALHVVVAAALLLGVFSMARIFGLTWYYLTLWAWGTTVVLIGAVLWSAVVVVQRWRGDTRSRTISRPLWLLAGVAMVVSVSTAISFANAEVPEKRLSEAVGSLAGPTAAALSERLDTGVDTTGGYLVRWSDAADIGSPGMGLFAELERRGFEVFADEYFHVPLTAHRVRPRTAVATQVHLATGSYIAAWQQAAADPTTGVSQVASYDGRSDAEIAEYRVTRERLMKRLGEEGHPELVPLVDTNLFGVSLDVRLSAADVADMSRLIALGQPMAVFIAPSVFEPLN